MPSSPLSANYTLEGGVRLSVLLGNPLALW